MLTKFVGKAHPSPSKSIMYYYETVTGYGRFKAESDEQAIEIAKKRFGNNLLILYKESDTKDGTPFIDLYERLKHANQNQTSQS